VVTTTLGTKRSNTVLYSRDLLLIENRVTIIEKEKIFISVYVEEFVVKSTFGTKVVETILVFINATCYDTILISAKYLYPKQRSRFTTNPLQRPLRQIFNRARYTMLPTCSSTLGSHCRDPVILRSNAIAILS
jgi:hypothetical protein